MCSPRLWWRESTLESASEYVCERSDLLPGTSGRDHGVSASVSKLEVTLGNSGWDGTVGLVPSALVIQVAFLSTVFLEDDGSVACGRDEKQG